MRALRELWQGFAENWVFWMFVFAVIGSVPVAFSGNHSIAWVMLVVGALGLVE